jgi:Glyoxalase superfamily protein
MLLSAVPVIRVSSSAAADSFFNRLGFKRQWDYRPNRSTADPCYMTVTRDDVLLHVTSFHGDGVPGGVVYIWVDDVNALHRELAARGVPLAGGPVDQTWGTCEFGVKDADGNGIRFGERLH